MFFSYLDKNPIPSKRSRFESDCFIAPQGISTSENKRQETTPFNSTAEFGDNSQIPINTGKTAGLMAKVLHQLNLPNNIYLPPPSSNRKDKTLNYVAVENSKPFSNNF